MLTIFINPDTTSYPPSFQAVKSPGLEEKTGADMVISFLSPNPLTGQIVSPVDFTESHIVGRSLFVQIKIGYDIVPTDDRLKSSISRMMKCRIPKGQATLLPVGDYFEKNSLLRVRGKKEFGNTPFSTLATIFDMWRMRGGSVHCDPTTPKDISQLQDWIDQKYKSIEKIQREGTRGIYPPSPVFEPDDIWQAVEEINDWRKFLVSGLTGFGSAKANAIFEYANENLPDGKLDFYQILCLMTDEISGKPAHKIPLWGDKSRKELRGILGIGDDENLSELAYRLAFYQGWRTFGLEFKRLVEKAKKPDVQKIHKKLMNENPMENQIPF